MMDTGEQSAMDDIGVPVDLYIYDLTRGMARTLSSLFLGKHVDGIWHTSIVAYGREYFFGAEGIQSCNPGGTVLGQPERIEKLGDTHIPYQIFIDYIYGLGDTTFRSSEYNLLECNCNTFSDYLANFLCGGNIPKYILDLPQDILTTPLGQSLKPLIESLSSGTQNLVSARSSGRRESPDFLQLNTQIEEARLQSLALEEKRNTINEKLARKERKKEKKKKKLLKEQEKLNNSSSEYSDLSNSGIVSPSCTKKGMAEAAAVEQMNGASSSNGQLEEMEEVQEGQEGQGRKGVERAFEIERQERLEEEERKRQREPPIVFKDFAQAADAFEAMNNALHNISLSAEDQQSLAELKQYMVDGEGSWALGDNFLSFIGNLLTNPALNVACKETVLCALAVAALKDDIVLLLHQDRREHVLMNYAHSIDKLSLGEQKCLAYFICNMFENLSSSEWLMYISEWSNGSQQISNIRVTTKVAIHSLLNEDPQMKDVGTAIIHNMACKEVFDDVAVEITMAILEYLSNAPGEEHLFRCLKSLHKFCQISGQDVPQLIQMIGPSPSTFKGTSPRVDELIDGISRKLR